MCGIAGIYNSNILGDDLYENISDVLVSLKHRGPDSNGFFKNENVILYHTRLSIIDTSSLANQPFSDISGRYQIIYNGEIFNFKELKKTLQKKGIAFKTQSDTEVLLNLYILEGVKCLQLLNGFFSFCIFDSKENSLFIAIDRYGIKPLYYSFQNNTLSFASELRTLLLLKQKETLDQTSVPMYFHLNYIPPPYSILKNIFKLEPGNTLTVGNNSILKEKYYEIKNEKKPLTPDLYSSAKNTLKTILEDAVKLRLISDVPIGCFLSGGVDSSIITAIASQHKNALKTFSVEFKNQPFFNETEFALSVSKMHKTNHTVITIDNKQVLTYFTEVLDCIDEPFADSSAIAVYAMCKEVRKHVTVALSGDGADEIFGGYLKHQAEYRARNPGFLEKIATILSPYLNLFPKSRNANFSNKIRQLSKFSQGVKLSNEERYWQWAGNDYNTFNLLHNKFIKTDNLLKRKIYYTEEIRNNNDLNSILLSDQKMVLPGDMLTKIDRMSMANSLEVRSPFLDYRIVDFANTLPFEFKVDRCNRKKILIDTFKYLLPRSVYTRTKKGFEIPLHFWFTTELKEKIEVDWLNLNCIKNEHILNAQEVEKLIKKLFSGNPENSPSVVWALIVFRNWYLKNYA